MSDIAGLGRRARLDAGTLGVVAVRVDIARQAIGLLRRGHGQGLTVLTAGEVTVDADTPEIPVGIDGETVLLPAPVRCAIQARALRVVVPPLSPRLRAAISCAASVTRRGPPPPRLPSPQGGCNGPGTR
jgi:diacylglycerol kinase family enzyme